MDLIEEIEYQELMLEAIKYDNMILLSEENIKLKDVISLAKKYSTQQLSKIGSAIAAFAKKAPDKFKPINDKAEGIINKIPFIGKINPTWRKKILFTLLMIIGGQMIKDFVSDFTGGDSAGSDSAGSDSAGSDSGPVDASDAVSAGGPIDIGRFINSNGSIDVTHYQDLLESEGNFSETFVVVNENVTGYNSEYGGGDSSFKSSSTYSPAQTIKELDELKQEYANADFDEKQMIAKRFRMHLQSLNEYKMEGIVDVNSNVDIGINAEDFRSQESAFYGVQDSVDSIADSNAELGIDTTNLKKDLASAIQQSAGSNNADALRQFVSKYPNIEQRDMEAIVQRVVQIRQSRSASGLDNL